MKRSLFFLLGLLMVVLAACGGLESGLFPPDGTEPEKTRPSHTEPAPTAPSQAPSAPQEAAEQVRQELLPENTSLEKAVSQAVVLEVAASDDATVTMVVHAPDVAQDMLTWLDSVDFEDLTEEAIEARLLEALSSEAQTQTFQLEVVDGQLQYTQEFRNAASCGIQDLYARLYLEALAEMEGDGQ